MIARIFWSFFPPSVGERYRLKRDALRTLWVCTAANGAYARLETLDGRQWRAVWRPWFILPGTNWQAA